MKPPWRHSRRYTLGCCHDPSQKHKYFKDLELLVLFNLRQKLLSLEGGDHSVREFRCAGLATDVPGGVFCLSIDLFEGILDPLRCSLLAEVVEHQNAAHEQGGWIGETLTGDVGRGTMHGLEHSTFVPDIGAGHNSYTTDKPRRQMAHDVTVKIRQ